MSKRKTEIERREDVLSVLSNKDHDKVILFQKQTGITIGDLLAVLNANSTICVGKTADPNPNEVDYRKVYFSAEQNAWMFVDGNKQDGFGIGRPVNALGKTYALTAPEMEKICKDQLIEEAEALSKAAESLETAGLRDQAEELREQADGKLTKAGFIAVEVKLAEKEIAETATIVDPDEIPL